MLLKGAWGWLFESAGDAPPTEPPTAVGDLVAVSRPNGRIGLSWTARATASGYRVYRGVSTGVTSATGTLVVDTAATSHEDTGLTPESDYYYVVVAYNVVGDAADSNEATAAAGALAPGRSSRRRRLWKRRFH